MKILRTLILLLLVACSEATPEAAPNPLKIEYTFAAQPWLADLADCIGQAPLSADLRAADYLEYRDEILAMRIGEPPDLLSPAYKIASEDVLVIVHPQNPAGSLTAEQVQDLFNGRITNWRSLGGSNEPVQIWVYSAAEDVQQLFNSTVMLGTPVTSEARLAAGPVEMANAVSSDPGAAGIMTRHWTAGNVQVAYAVASVPVLILTGQEPTPELEAFLACLQE